MITTVTGRNRKYKIIDIAHTVLLDRNFTANLLDVSLNISKTTRTLRATNITLKTTTKMLPKIKKEISNF